LTADLPCVQSKRNAHLPTSNCRSEPQSKVCKKGGHCNPLQSPRPGIRGEYLRCTHLLGWLSSPLGTFQERPHYSHHFPPFHTFHSSLSIPPLALVVAPHACRIKCCPKGFQHFPNKRLSAGGTGWGSSSSILPVAHPVCMVSDNPLSDHKPQIDSLVAMLDGTSPRRAHIPTPCCMPQHFKRRAAPSTPGQWPPRDSTTLPALPPLSNGLWHTLTGPFVNPQFQPRPIVLSHQSSITPATASIATFAPLGRPATA
jgi:hypothetical protein